MTIYYEKIGRRYRPVSDSEALRGLTTGAWLVIVNPGCTTLRRLLDVAHAPVLAAAHAVRAAMIEAMCKAAEMTPHSRTLTDAEKRGLAAFRDAAGPDAMMTMSRASAQEIIDAGIDVLIRAVSAQQKGEIE